LVHELNNADKHRQIQLFTGHIGSIGYGPEAISTGLHLSEYLNLKRRMHLKNGTKVGEIAPDLQGKVKMDHLITPNIFFWWGCKAIERHPVIPALGYIAKGVNDVIDLFVDEF